MKVLEPATWLSPWQWQLLVLSTLVKLLLIPLYHSTDFEVHRNWLAITHSLPLSQWYFDTTSKWTLDYPPFFAYFSWLLSVPASWWDPRIVALHDGLEYADWSCKVFMRLTVIGSEALTMATALFALSTHDGSRAVKKQHVLPPWAVAAMLLHPGLIIIDHVHFQYNGFLYGILLWSVWAARQGKHLLCAFLFSTLLNFKHIYVYVAPAYFVFLLQAYVIQGGQETRVISRSGMGERLFTLAVITVVPFIVSLLPLALSGLTASAPAGPIEIVRQMVSRLFPFSRGLNHAYWAANAWALYTFADRVLVKLLNVKSQHGNVTRGIIGDTNFDVLPSISAGHCFLLTLTFTVLLCTRLWTRPKYGTFVESIALFGLTSFLFGFHVHEKAILIALIPLTLLSHISYTTIRKTLVLTVAGTVGLFPLLFEACEMPIKIVYSFVWLLATPFASTFGMRFSTPAATTYLDQHFTPTNWDLLIHFAEDVYLGGFALLVFFVEVAHPMLFANRGVGSTSSLLGMQPDPVFSRASAAAASAIGRVGMPSLEATQQPAESLLDVASSAASQAASSISSFVADAGAAAASTASTVSEGLTSHSPSLEFLPLMLTSVYCAIGVVWVWLALGARFVGGCDEAADEEEAEPHSAVSNGTSKGQAKLTASASSSSIAVKR